MAVISGDRQIDRQLRRLEARTAKKALTAGIKAGQMKVAKAMRAAINATDASADLKREARKSIGSRFTRGGVARTGKITARVSKVGFSVAKKHKTLKKTGEGRSRGVGISAANIHWFVLGTKDRHHDSGKSVGRIEAVFGDVTEKAFTASKGAALEAARAKVTQVIQREARRKT